MTCEVAVMNKRGIALAADSAVTLGDGKKIYQTAEKLFSLSSTIPVAIMTFGNAEMMGVPWETVIKIYAKTLGGRTFEALDGYATDFFRFIEKSSSLFPDDCQRSWVENIVGRFWSELYCSRLQEKLAAKPTDASVSDKVAALLGIIQEDHADWANYPPLEEAGSELGQRILECYADSIERAEAAVFDPAMLTPEIRRHLRETVRLMFEKRWIDPLSFSGIVIAGMGESEPFPGLLVFHVGTIAAGKLRYIKADECRIKYNDEASVIPFGQTQTIDMIFQGIEPSLKSEFLDSILNLPKDAQASPEEIKHRETEREKASDRLDEISKRHYRPLVQAVAALSRQDLAKMAYSLVSITAFLLRMNVNESETVSEPIDLAVLSKGEGFVWIRHKEISEKGGDAGRYLV